MAEVIHDIFISTSWAVAVFLGHFNDLFSDTLGFLTLWIHLCVCPDEF